MTHELQEDGRVHGVVFGCRREDGRYLMVRRSRHVPLPGKVCFPGGGINAGETQEAACIREAQEELGICVLPLKVIWRCEFGDGPIKIFGWLAVLEPGAIRPDPLEIEEVLWLNRAEALAHPDGLETNAGFIDALDEAFALVNRNS